MRSRSKRHKNRKHAEFIAAVNECIGKINISYFNGSDGRLPLYNNKSPKEEIFQLETLEHIIINLASIKNLLGDECEKHIRDLFLDPRVEAWLCRDANEVTFKADGSPDICENEHFIYRLFLMHFNLNEAEKFFRGHTANIENFYKRMMPKFRADELDMNDFMAETQRRNSNLPDNINLYEISTEQEEMVALEVVLSRFIKDTTRKKEPRLLCTIAGNGRHFFFAAFIAQGNPAEITHIYYCDPSTVVHQKGDRFIDEGCERNLNKRELVSLRSCFQSKSKTKIRILPEQPQKADTADCGILAHMLAYAFLDAVCTENERRRELGSGGGARGVSTTNNDLTAIVEHVYEKRSYKETESYTSCPAPNNGNYETYMRKQRWKIGTNYYQRKKQVLILDTKRNEMRSIRELIKIRLSGLGIIAVNGGQNEIIHDAGDDTQLGYMIFKKTNNRVVSLHLQACLVSDEQTKKEILEAKRDKGELEGANLKPDEYLIIAYCTLDEHLDLGIRDLRSRVCKALGIAEPDISMGHDSTTVASYGGGGGASAAATTTTTTTSSTAAAAVSQPTALTEADCEYAVQCARKIAKNSSLLTTQITYSGKKMLPLEVAATKGAVDCMMLMVKQGAPISANVVIAAIRSPEFPREYMPWLRKVAQDNNMHRDMLGKVRTNCPNSNKAAYFKFRANELTLPSGENKYTHQRCVEIQKIAQHGVVCDRDNIHESTLYKALKEIIDGKATESTGDVGENQPSNADGSRAYPLSVYCYIALQSKPDDIEAVLDELGDEGKRSIPNLCRLMHEFANKHRAIEQTGVSIS